MPVSAPARPATDIRQLIAVPGLDAALAADPRLAAPFEATLDEALAAAFGGGEGDQAAHRFVQRTLYQINRLSFFWFDPLSNYDNERSTYLARIRERIEARWQGWETGHMDLAALRVTSEVQAALRERAARDVVFRPSRRADFFARQVGLAGYRRLLEIFSLDALVEASQLSRTLGGVGNHVHAYVTRVLLEEYGGGRPHHKHSAYFGQMLEHFGMDATPEAYADAVPWEVLANINQSFLLSERKRWYLRYMGGLLYTETSTPAGFTPYHQAALRIGVPEAASIYWSIHIKADRVHGRWMLEEIALPLAERYPYDAWELLWGYDQQAAFAERAGHAIMAEARIADAEARQGASALPAAA